MELPLRWMIWGYLHFRKPPYGVMRVYFLSSWGIMSETQCLVHQPQTGSRDGLWHWVYHINGGFSKLDPQVTMGFNTKMFAYDLDDLRGFLIIMDYDEKEGW